MKRILPLMVLFALVAMVPAAPAQETSANDMVGPVGVMTPGYQNESETLADENPADVYVYDMESHTAVREPAQDPGDLSTRLITGSRGVLSFPSSSIQSVWGDDNRSRVADTTQYPWRTICRLRITYPGSSGTYIGTGAVIDDFHVLTAGHVVYDRKDGLGWAESIEVIPGQTTDGDGQILMPFGKAKATGQRSYSGWVEDGVKWHDWAVITLDRSIGRYTGWMGMTNDYYWSGIYTGNLAIAGYPGDLDGGSVMYQDANLGREASLYNHWYYMDTYGGMSGSPVWYLQDGEPYILTVHTAADDETESNMGTRLNDDKLDSVTEWVASDDAPQDKPDLIDNGEAHAEFAPITAIRGETDFEIQCSVGNLGTAQSPGSSVAFYASPDLTIDATDHLIGTGSLSPIDPFQSATCTWSGTFPETIPAGTYFAGWIIDPDDQVDEFDETNNPGVYYEHYLYVSDGTVENNPPDPPQASYPADGESGVVCSPALSWTCTDPDGDSLTYDISMGLSVSALECIDEDRELTYILRQDLEPETQYFWKVVADDGLARTESQVWNFTTRAEGTEDQAPVADFTADPTRGLAPLAVQFTDLSSGDPTGWAWYFGDEDFKNPWTQMTAGAGWSVRERHSSVALPDGSIVLMGGIDTNYKCKNDVWRSTDGGATWTEVAANAAWSARCGHSSVALPDGSIVLTGGHNGGGANAKNDVWRSTDNGATWTQMAASAAWPARYEHTSVALPDGSIVLMGGYNGTTLMNDVWRSTDNGATWTQINAGAAWSGRYWCSSVALPDGSIVLMGGYGGGNTNDVWRSTDNGATWTQMTGSAAWSARAGHSSVALPDGSIVLMAGYDVTWKSDVWRSTDNGATWTQMTAGVTWAGRAEHSSVALPDGSIVLMGGYSMGSDKNDVWRLTTAGSSEQHPSHTYTEPGVYQVILQASNAAGIDTLRKAGYISVSEATPPIANFTANVTSGLAPLAVQFTDLSSQNPAGWAWYFGDEDFKDPWTQMTAGAAWSARYGHASVALPDGSIVLMGGSDGSTKNDVWRSTDNGVTWKEMTAGAAWSARYGHSAVALPDGSIVLMGGYSSGYRNDVWRSTDNGATWTQMTASAPWTGRTDHTSVALPDGSIVLMGGYGGYDVGNKNDVWRSTDGGATWTQMTASAGWYTRCDHASVALPDGSIVLMGGYWNDVWRSTDNGATWTQMTDSAAWSDLFDHTGAALPDGSMILMGGRDLHIFKSGAWRSTDNGATWTQMNASAGWSGRHDHSSVVLPDGSVVLMGGYDGSNRKNDVWRLTTAGSSEQHPSHTYNTRPGVYQVVLQAYNVAGSDIMRKTEYIGPAPVANFTADITTGTAPLTVQFTDTSTNYPTTWSWSFGDGGTATDQHPAHTYAAGNYTVSLTVSNGGENDTVTREQYIRVQKPLPGAALTFNTNYYRGTSDDSIASGTSSCRVTYHTAVSNLGNTQESISGNLSFMLDAPSIVALYPDTYAEISGTRATWSFPASTAIGPGSTLSTTATTSAFATRTSGVTLERSCSPTTFTEMDMQQVTLNMTFDTVDLDGLWGRIECSNTDDVGSAFVQGTVSTDLPWLRITTESKRIEFVIDPSRVEAGRQYSLSCTVAVAPSRPVIFAPACAVWEVSGAASAPAEAGTAVTLPAALRPEDVSSVGFSSDTLCQWSCTRNYHVISSISQRAVPAPAAAPLVTDPAATPAVIPADTDASPGAGETAVLSAMVTGADVASVTVDLSAIGGPATAAMTDAGDGIWTMTTAAAVASPFADGAYLPVHLPVNATNTDGVSNTTVSIPLTVVQNGDASEDNRVMLYDAVYVARHAIGMDGYPMTESVGMVSGGDDLSLHDAMYLANYVLGIPGYEQLR